MALEVAFPPMLYPLVLFLGVIFAYGIFVAKKKARFYKLIKGGIWVPPELPIIGNLHTLARFKTSEAMWRFLYEQCCEHPEGGVMWIGHIPIMAILDPEVIDSILSSPEAVEKNRIYNILKPITNGIFIAETNRWKKLRKKLNLMFSPKLLEQYLDDVNEQTGILINVLGQESGKEINIQSFFERAFYDIVTRTHFGVETFEQHEKKDLIHVVATAVETLINHRLLKPYLHSETMYKFTKSYKEIARMKGVVAGALQKVLEISIENSEKEKRGEIKRKYGPSYTDYVTSVFGELNMAPTMSNYFFNCLDLIIAGSDTTSVAMSELFYRLSQHPDVQEKVYEEAVTVFGSDRFRPLTKAEVASLTYTDMVIKESLRFSSPPGMFRELQNDLDVGKYIIPKGTNVYMLMDAMHKNPLYYEKPHEFYPDHFLPEHVQNRPRVAFLAFSLGPRNCPGKAFAYLTIKILTAAVVRNFYIQCDKPADKVVYKPVLMQEQVDGYHLRLIKRD